MTSSNTITCYKKYTYTVKSIQPFQYCKCKSNFVFHPTWTWNHGLHCTWAMWSLKILSYFWTLRSSVDYNTGLCKQSHGLKSHLKQIFDIKFTGITGLLALIHTHIYNIHMTRESWNKEKIHQLVFQHHFLGFLLFSNLQYWLLLFLSQVM